MGGIRNWFQRNCDCGMAIHWPIEGGEDLEGLHRCHGYRDRDQRKRWRRAERNGMKEMPEAQEEEEEVWEKEEMATAG